MVKSAVRCLDSRKQPIGPVDKNQAEKANTLKVPVRIGNEPVGPSARGLG